MQITNEIQILRDLRGQDGIADLRAVYYSNNTHVHLIFDFAEGGTLTDYIRDNSPVKESISRSIIK